MRGWLGRVGRFGGIAALAMWVPLGVLGWHCLVQNRNLGFPLDDSWIHLTYARNLSQYLEIALNHGQPSTGATSLLWMVLLSVGLFLHLPAVAWSMCVSLVVYALYLGVMSSISLATQDPGRRAEVVFLSALAGPVVFYGLSGMETLLFATLEFAALYLAIGRQQWRLGGLLGALAAMTRPEGVLLLGPLLLFGLGAGRQGTSRARWMSGLALAAGGLGIYLLVNYVVGGSVLPSSFSGRRNLASGSPSITWSGSALVSSLQTLLSTWVSFVWRYGLGTVQGAGGGPSAFSFSGLAWGLMKGAWLGLAGLGIVRAWSSREGSARLVRALCVLMLEHDLLYGLLLPNIGHAGRYLANNLLLLPFLVTYGGGLLWRREQEHESPLRRAMLRAGGRLFPYTVALVGMGSWAGTYSSAVEHINQVHVAAGQWIAENVPKGELVAAFDIGAISFLGGHPVLDLGGLADPTVLEDIRQRQLAARLMRARANWLALPDWWESHLLLNRLGLVAIPLQTFQVTSISPQLHADHWDATLNALPAIYISRLNWADCRLLSDNRVACAYPPRLSQSPR